LSRNPTRAWLAGRLGDTSPDLAADILRLLDGVPPADLADPPRALALAALAGFEEVVTGTGRRVEALRLLAADAALTYAFEAAAEQGTVSELAEWVGLRGEIGRRLAAMPGAAGARDA